MSDRSDNPASPKQLDYIKSLMGTREVPADVSGLIQERMDTFTIARASAMISYLQLMPRPEADLIPASRTPEVPAGRYGLTLDGTDHLIKVSTPTRGRWAGYVFLTDLDDDTSIRGERKATILKALAQDPTTCLARYGKITGRCGHCGRTLTDPESITRGIGPICLANM